MRAEETAKLAVLRRKGVEGRTGVGRSSMYQLIKAGSFPKPIKLGGSSVGWLEHEIEEWIRLRADAR